MKIKKSELKKMPGSRVDISVVLDKETIEEAKSKALEGIKNKTVAPGFRPGKIPLNIIEKQYGEDGLRDEAILYAVNQLYPSLLIEHKIRPISDPELKIDKTAQDNGDILLNLLVYIHPEIELPDYKSIAKNTPKEEEVKDIEEKEVNDALDKIASHFKTINSTEFPADVKIDDEFATKIGNFKNLTELKEKIKSEILEEKKYREGERRKMKIMDEICEKTKVEIPDILLKDEADENKKEQAIKRTKTQLVISEIAKRENLLATEDEASHFAHAMDNGKTGMSHEDLHSYARILLTNQKTLDYLAGLN